MNVKVSKLEFFMLLSAVMENTDAFTRISDEDGYILVPEDRLEDFYRDMGLVVGRILDKVGRPE
jgi:hypothetical protein